MKQSKPTVLVADDDVGMITALAKRLICSGFDVITAANATDALAAFAQQTPDVVLLDVQMPDMDGFSVCQHLREKPACRNIPVFFMTGARDGIIRKYLDRLTSHAGGNHYLTKPFDNKTLVSMLRSATNTAASRSRLDAVED